MPSLVKLGLVVLEKGKKMYVKGWTTCKQKNHLSFDQVSVLKALLYVYQCQQTSPTEKNLSDVTRL